MKTYERDSNSSDSTLKFYEENAKAIFQGTVSINMTTLYAPFLGYMPTYANILDAGCGSGRDALYFTSRGYRVTAFDYSPSLVSLACKYTGQEVLELSFQELDFVNQFDGVWACSSLLHVPLDEHNEVLSKLSRSMKVDGTLYTSYKLGMGEHYRDGRFFVDFDKDGFDELIKEHSELAVQRYWQTSDLRPGRENEKWLNILVRKTKATKEN